MGAPCTATRGVCARGLTRWLRAGAQGEGDRNVPRQAAVRGEARGGQEEQEEKEVGARAVGAGAGAARRGPAGRPLGSAGMKARPGMVCAAAAPRLGMGAFHYSQDSKSHHARPPAAMGS